MLAGAAVIKGVRTGAKSAGVRVYLGVDGGLVGHILPFLQHLR
jgi:hypothetical protein